MSRLAKKPIKIPDNVKIKASDHCLSIEGPKGRLTKDLHPDIKLDINEKEHFIKVLCPPLNKNKGIHGLYYALISNMILGVTKGFTKGLEIIGLGYNVKTQGKKLILQLGFSHPVNVDIPEGIEVEILNPTNPGKLNIKGIDKYMVGQFAANLRALQPPEPYKGKGIKYADEIIRRKAGKALATTS